MDLPPFHNSSFCWAFLLTPSCLCLFFYSPCFLNYTGVIQVVVGIILLFWEWWLFMITAENFFGDNRNSRSENIFKCFHFLQRNSLLLIFGHDFLQQRIATYSIMYRNVCNFINIHMEKKKIRREAIDWKVHSHSAPLISIKIENYIVYHPRYLKQFMALLDEINKKFFPCIMRGNFHFCFSQGAFETLLLAMYIFLDTAVNNKNSLT